MVEAIPSWLRPRTPTVRLEGIDRPWWWQPNVAAFHRMVESAGFEILERTPIYFLPHGVAHPRRRPAARWPASRSPRPAASRSSASGGVSPTPPCSHTRRPDRPDAGRDTSPAAGFPCDPPDGQPSGLPDKSPAEALGLRRRAARGMLINAVFLAGLTSLGLIKGFVVAAFLSRSDYGVWGLLVVTLGTLGWLKQIGVSDRYVQQRDDDQELAFQRAFTLEILFSGRVPPARGARRRPDRRPLRPAGAARPGLRPAADGPGVHPPVAAVGLLPADGVPPPAPARGLSSRSSDSLSPSAWRSPAPATGA